MKRATRYGYRTRGIAPEAALAVWAQLSVGGQAWALTYDPRVARFWSAHGGRLWGVDEQPADLTAVFEYRVFHPDAEMRWVRVPGTQWGDAVLTSEQPLPAPWAADAARDVGLLPCRMLIWGRVQQAIRPGWVQMAEARIGVLAVPVDREQGQRVYVVGHDYVESVGDYHNARVTGRRLMALTGDPKEGTA